jgi:Ala-tRNA(Pro) deacylase
VRAAPDGILTHEQRGEAGLRADLAALGIAFAEHEHKAVFTVAESSALDARIPGAHTKNLFLKDEGGMFWLLTVPAQARIDLKALPQAIGCKRVSFARPEEMERLLGISPGSVTPLAMIHATPGSVTAVLEEGLAAAERVNVHPLRNTATMGLAGADILRLLEHWGHEPVVAAIPTTLDRSSPFLPQAQMGRWQPRSG